MGDVIETKYTIYIYLAHAYTALPAYRSEPRFLLPSEQYWEHVREAKLGPIRLDKVELGVFVGLR